jgi:hypothetical protein
MVCEVAFVIKTNVQMRKQIMPASQINKNRVAGFSELGRTRLTTPATNSEPNSRNRTLNLLGTRGFEVEIIELL